MPIVTANAKSLQLAAQTLREGGLVAFATETVYGLGCDATNAEAVARCFAAKGRPSFNPLIVHVTGLDAAITLGAFGTVALRLAQTFWPGPLTLVVPRLAVSPLSELATAGLDTVALRVPSHPIARELIAATGRPLAAPSANRSGRVSPTSARHVLADFGDEVPLILDGGDCEHGLESTVVAVHGEVATVLRPGAVTREALEEVLGRSLVHFHGTAERPASPGQLASHYAPHAPVRLNATTVTAGEALLAFGPQVPEHEGPTFNLSARADLIEAAAGLFGALRALDRMQPSGIAVMPIPDDGLGLAINDRLKRAAAPRS